MVFAWGVSYLASNDNKIIGRTIIEISGFEYSISPTQLLLFLGLMILAVWIFLKIASLFLAVLRFINGDETAVSRYFSRNRERKGYKALSEGMMALASGEGSAALIKAKKAEKYLRKPSLTNLLAAQAAEIAGESEHAEEIYKELILDPTTRFVGVRGIMKKRLSEGDTDTALKLAEKAFSLKPKHEETQDVLINLQTLASDWRGARKTLKAKMKYGNLTQDVHKRRDAVLALSEAADITETDKKTDTQVMAIEANRMSPDLVPAAVLAAREHLADSKKKNAIKVIKKAWESQPHPDLAAVYSEIFEEESQEEREKGFKLLAKMNSKHVETKTMMAEMYLQAEDFPSARRSLGDSYETSPNVRTLTIMAAIEKGEGADDNVIRKWLTKALAAPRGPQWVCENCSTIHAVWRPTCFNCNALDTLAWMDAPEVKEELTLGNERLPFVLDVLNSDGSEADQINFQVEENSAELENIEVDEATSKS
tara:strand:+ start:1689 stop:3134 length:1446 start_codon:yes stop_codon:yes gene_type:complete